MTLIGAAGGPQFEIDPEKSTVSKVNCLRSADIKTLLEQWGNGEVCTADAQVMLLSFLVSWYVQSLKSRPVSSIVRPGMGPS